MKILIVGASVSGLTCAEWILRGSAQAEVLVIDKREKIGVPQRCAGGISRYMVERANLPLDLFTRSVVGNIAKVRIYAPNNDCFEFQTGKDYGLVLDRVSLEQNMAERVQHLGGKIRLNHEVRFPWRALLQDFNIIVGADGPTSTVRDWLGIPRHKPYDLHLGVQKTVYMDYLPPDTIEIYFGEKVAPKGYAWIFPIGNGMVRIGLGSPLSENPNVKVLLENFINRQVVEYKAVEHIAKLIPTDRHPKTGVFDNVLLVGDALPSTDPLTGGGIIQGMASGKAAGEAIVEGDLKSYDSRISWLRKQNNRRYALKNVLCSFSDRDFNDLVEVMKGFSPKTMSLGKELGHAILRVSLKKPRLIRKFLKGLR